MRFEKLQNTMCITFDKSVMGYTKLHVHKYSMKKCFQLQ